MVNSVLEILIKAKDQAGRVIKGLSEEAARAKKAFEDLNRVDTSKLPRDLEKLRQRAKEVGVDFDKLGVDLRKLNKEGLTGLVGHLEAARAKTAESIKAARELGKHYEDITRSGVKLAAAGAAPLLFGAKAIADAAEYSLKIAQIAALSGGGIEATEAFRKTVLDLAAAFGDSRADVAAALYKAVGAGAREGAQQVVLLTAANKLADASATDLMTSTEALVKVIKGFNLDFSQAGDVADALFVTVQKGNIPLSDLTNFLAQLSPLAAAAGLQFTEVTAAIQAMGASGLEANRAFNLLRVFINAVSKPTKELNTLFRQYGDGTAEATLRSRGLVGVLQILQKATGGSRSQLIGYLGSQEAANAAVLLTTKNFEKFNQALGEQANRAGAAADAAKTVNESLGKELSASLNKVSNAMVAIGNSIGTVLLPVIRLIGSAADAVRRFAEEHPRLIGFVGGLITVLGGLAVAFGSLLVLYGTIGSGIVKLILLFRSLPAPIFLVAKAFEVLIVAARATGAALTLLLRTPLVAVIAAVTAAIVAIARLAIAIRDWRDAAKQVADMQEKARAKLEELDAAGARNVQIKATNDLISLTNEEIKTYQQALIEKLKLVGAERQLALLRGDTTAAERANQLEKELMASIESSAGVLKARAEEFRNVKNVIQELSPAYERSSEDVAALIVSLNQLNEFSAQGLLDTLDVMHNETIRQLEVVQEQSQLTATRNTAFFEFEQSKVITFIRRNTRALIAEDMRYNREKLRITKSTADRALQIANIEFNEKAAVINREEQNELAKQQKLLALAREYSQRRVQIQQQETQAIIAQRDQAFKKLDDFQKQVLDLDKKIRDTRLSQELELQELQKQGLSEAQKIQATELQLEDLKSRTRQALEAQDFALAEDFARRRIELLKANATQLGGFFGQPISEQESLTKAVEETAAAQKDVLDALAGQRAVVADSAAAQKTVAEELQASVEKAKAQLSEAAAQALAVEVNLDDTGAKQAINALVQPTSSTHTVAADTFGVETAIRRLEQPTFSTHTVNVVTTQAGVPQANEGFATGGHVKGPGSGTSDSILAMLSNGEFVAKAAAVKHYGASLFARLNNLQIPKRALKFALGGMVPRAASQARVPAFANGGPVTGTSSGENLGTMVFSFGAGRSVTVKTNPEGAKTLQREFQNLSRHGVGVRKI